MDLLDREVFTVITALVLIGSLIALFEMDLGWAREHYISISLLNERCLIGGYPVNAYVDTPVKLCIEVHNELGYPVYARIVYKIADNTTLPSREKPSPEKERTVYELLVDNGETRYLRVNISIPMEYAGRRIAIVFELWIYDPETNEWVYTGRWTHLFVYVIEVPL